MTNLSTTYLGLRLKNPLVASASPLSADVDDIRRLEGAGAAAVVLPSLFEEQIELQNLGAASSAFDQMQLPDALQHIPDMVEYNRGASGYLAHIYQAKRAVKIPVIASLNGYYGGGWVRYARLLEAAGADALEMNIYYLASKPHISGADVENMHLDLVRNVKSSLKIPVAVKISPYFSAMAHFAMQLAAAGADGLVLFNRFYQPDFDLETRAVVPSLDLSTSVELRLRLRWVSILFSTVKADFAVTGGVHTAADVLKSIMAGATVAMMTSALLKHGIGHLRQVLDEVAQWTAAHDIEALADLRGTMSQTAVADPAALERANYMNVLQSRRVDKDEAPDSST